MNSIDDLNIKNDLLPLFDYSRNLFTKAKIVSFINTPLSSEAQIINQQSIIKGFVANYSVLQDYNYTFLYFNQVYQFLEDDSFKAYLEHKTKFRYFISNREKIDYQSKVTQLVLFLHKLEYTYFSRIDSAQFPVHYQNSIKDIQQTLLKFNLSYYKNKIASGRLKNKALLELTQIIADVKATDNLETFWDHFFTFEAYLSISIGLKKNDFNFPEISKTGIALTEMFHPLLEQPVKNDFATNSTVIVLNGPNMSGKSTFLRTLGLCIYLGNLGFAIPAKTGKIPICNNFSIQLNKKDNIKKGLSHFMFELKTLKNTVNNAVNGANCFAVFDELFSGTNSDDATAILKTTIAGLSKFTNSFFFISTHIQEIKSVSNDNIAMYYMHCDLYKDTPQFTFKIKQGWTDIKIGKLLFEKEGLDRLLK